MAIIKKQDNIIVLGDAQKAEIGVPKVVQLKPNIILMDIRLKGTIDGSEATKDIIEKCPETKIIVFTSDPNDEMLHTRHECQKQNALSLWAIAFVPSG